MTRKENMATTAAPPPTAEGKQKERGETEGRPYMRSRDNNSSGSGIKNWAENEIILIKLF